MVSKQQLQAFGLNEEHLVPFQQDNRIFYLEKESLLAFKQLQQAARKAGFELAIVSSHRNFDRQAAIWNGKAEGKRALLDKHGQVMDYQQLSKQELLAAILCWSAVPGLSRHHWGCDIDVYDANAMSLSDVQLVPSEVEDDGACAALHRWLDEQIQNNQSHGFFRPYSNNACKVAEEKWHLSYWPVAKQMQQHIAADVITPIWQEKKLCLLELLEQQAKEIVTDYGCLDFTRLPSWLGG